MPTRAVLFDYHQTLFRFEGDEPWIAASARERGLPMTPTECRNLARRLDAARAWPDVLALGNGRDLSTPAHHSFIRAWLRLAGTPKRLAEALYARLITPLPWLPYPDTEPVLRCLAERGIAVGIVSNTGWDLRDTFHHYGLARHVGTFVLSCERGVEKPAPDLFLAACAELGVRPADTLMVGDNPATDGGSVTAGIAAYLVCGTGGDAPRGLDGVLKLADITPPACVSSAGSRQENGDTNPTRYA
jgi:HAD superfamily hydrolase (TIGR01509 family)